MTPPIPARLAHRPTVGGLVVPWISVHHADGRATLGAVHGARVDVCLSGCRCQTCGAQLGHRIVLFARPIDFAHGYVSEPGMHPECAAYSVLACPMLNGRMIKHRSTPHSMAGKPCADVGCGCEGWLPASDNSLRSGASAPPYYQVWIRRHDYSTALDASTTDPIGVALADVAPLKIRLVSRGRPSNADLARIALAGLPWKEL